MPILPRQSGNNPRFDFEDENIYSFPPHRGRSIPTFNNDWVLLLHFGFQQALSQELYTLYSAILKISKWSGEYSEVLNFLIFQERDSCVCFQVALSYLGT